jgi:2-keto-3-deoxy-L-rhamnonate aldolase RhmA
VSHWFTAEVMARQGFDALAVDRQRGTTGANPVPLMTMGGASFLAPKRQRNMGEECGRE